MFQCIDSGEMQLSVQSVPKVYHHTKYQICQFSCIYFATLPFTVGSGLFYRIQLVEFDFPEFLHILFQVDT